MKSTWITLTVIILSTCLMLGCSSDKSDSYKVGIILSLTDRGATYGERSLRGIQLATDQLNATENFKDKPIELIIEDSESSGSGALTALRKLVSIDRVNVVIGMVLSDEVLTCAPFANKTKTIIFTPGAGSTKIREAGDYIFRNRESATLQAEIIAKACIEQYNFKEVAILHANAANGISYRDSFKKAIEDLNGKVAKIVGYNENKTDFRAEIEQLRESNAKAVYLAGHDTEMGMILKQSREVGYAPQYFASAGAVSKKLLEISKEAAEGMICATAPFNIESDEINVKGFVEAYTNKYGSAPDWIAANSYDAVKIIAGILTSGAETSDKIKDALYSVQQYNGVGGITTFDSYGDVVKPVDLVIITEGVFVRMGDN
ncbi:MAG: ABC transporter substrate-binding protein [candidate division Zixibacteria bacterium]|nr:ABC transporter substrate-binding protein [candidate division Zixibacteria bacterium]